MLVYEWLWRATCVYNGQQRATQEMNEKGMNDGSGSKSVLGMYSFRAKSICFSWVATCLALDLAGG